MWELEERELSLPGFVQGNSTSSFETALRHLSSPTTETIPSLYLPRGDTESFLRASKSFGCLENSQQDLTTAPLCLILQLARLLPTYTSCTWKAEFPLTVLCLGAARIYFSRGKAPLPSWRGTWGRQLRPFLSTEAGLILSLPTRVLSFHNGSDFLVLTTIPLGISRAQHIFRLDSTGFYHNKSFRAAFMEKKPHPLVIIFWNKFPFILKSRLEQK